MALIDVNLADGDQTIDQNNANDGDTLEITGLSNNTLTIDGVSVAIQNFLSIFALSSPTFEVKNGGNLHFDPGLLNGQVLSSINFIINDNSTITYDAGGIAALDGLLSDINVTFNGAEDGRFTYIPPNLAILSSQTIQVDGMEKLDQIEIDGRNNLDFSYDPDTMFGVLISRESGLLGLTGHTVRFEISGVTQAQADLIFADLADVNVDIWIDGDVFTLPVCLTEGTAILTDVGERLIEDLEPGDLIWTKDHGYQALRWIGRKEYSKDQYALAPKHFPIRISKDSLGPGRPVQDIRVSPQHRVLLSSRIVERMFDAEEILVPAKKLVDMAGIYQEEDFESVVYMHLLFDQHEVIMANGALVESLLPGPMALKSMSSEEKEELEEIFPEIFTEGFRYEEARLIGKGRKINTMIKRHIANQMPLNAF